MALINPDDPKFDKQIRHRKLKARAINMDRTKCTIRIPTNIFLKFRKKLLDERKTANEVLVDSILKYLEK